MRSEPLAREILRSLRRQRCAVSQRSMLVLSFFAAEAQKEGLLDRPEARELLHFARLQVAEHEMQRELQRKAQPTPEEIQNFYNTNPQRFTELTLDRILVPLRKANEGLADTAENKLAEDLRQRAMAGTDFKTLQKEAYDKTGLQNPLETRVTVRAWTLPSSHQSLLQLKPGELSPVIQDPLGLYIYKLISRHPIPLDAVKQEIQNTLIALRKQQEIKEFTRSMNITLNPEYFGPPPAIRAQPKPVPVTGQTPAVETPAVVSASAISAALPTGSSRKTEQVQPPTPVAAHP